LPQDNVDFDELYEVGPVPPGWGQASSPLAIVVTKEETVPTFKEEEKLPAASIFVATPKENMVSLPSHILKAASVVKKETTSTTTKSVTTS